MLIKSADDRAEDIAELNAMLAEAKLTPAKKKRVQEELRNLKKGVRGEQQAAYLLDFHFRGSDAHLIIHNLRIVLSDGRTAQIDHLLVNSFQDFYLLESKNWTQLTVDKTGACTTGDRHIIEVPPPLEQCRRHESVLARAFQIDSQLRDLAPRYQIIPRVLVATRCHLKAPFHQEWYMKADLFYSQRAKEVENLSFVKSVLDLPRFTSHTTLVKLGQALLELHNPPDRINWRAKFGLSTAPPEAKTPANKVVASIEGLADYVPKWGKDWFVLKADPTDERLVEWRKRIKAAGYQGEKNEKGEWVWRLKV